MQRKQPSVNSRFAITAAEHRQSGITLTETQFACVKDTASANGTAARYCSNLLHSLTLVLAR
eukprot:3788-Heterococcus_DN1.PRE.3